MTFWLIPTNLESVPGRLQCLRSVITFLLNLCRIVLLLLQLSNKNLLSKVKVALRYCYHKITILESKKNLY